MDFSTRLLSACVLVTLSASAAHSAAKYDDTVSLFQKSQESAAFFRSSYAYAVFPTVGEGAFIVGAGHGDGRVYAKGKYTGDVSVTELNIGLQAGGKAFSEIIFFRDKRALAEFESGTFEFGGDASVVVITAGASASGGTNGAQSGASGGMKDAVLRGEYYKGMAVFTIPKGGLMGDLSVGGEKFKYVPKES